MNPRWVQRRGSQRARREARRLLAPLYCDECGMCEGGLVAPVMADPSMRIVEAVVDSGAEESVAPPGIFPEAVEPSLMSRAGKGYRAANGSALPNLGQLVAHFQEAEGRAGGIPVQVAKVERPLISVSRLAAVGCKVSFQGDAGEILHVSSGRRLPLFRRSGVYALEMRVRSERGGSRGRRQPATSAFPRQGQ